MGFTTDEGMVRIDFFKLTGKWVMTKHLKWDRYFPSNEDPLLKSTQPGRSIETIHDTFKRCIAEQYPNLSGYQVICLEPYHENAHPLSIII